MSSERQRILLLDMNNIVFRSYFALPPMTSPAGRRVEAIYGTMRVMARLVKEWQPAYLAPCFDVSDSTVFRRQLYPDYKGHRPDIDPELASQFAPLKQLLVEAGLPLYQLEGYEADDLIGTLAGKSCASGLQPLVVSGDRDLTQLVNDDVHMLYLAQGEDQYLDPSGVQELTGVPPHQVVDWKALSGDKSDNIPGVPWVGDVIAQRLLAEYGDLDTILAHLDEPAVKINKRALASMRKHQDQARLSRRLAEIRCDAPVDLTLQRVPLDGLSTWTLDQIRQLVDVA